ncbi:MAG: O-antigen ligase family protein [Chloroflexota bacterium]
MKASALLELGAVALGLAVFGYLAWDGALWDARFQLLLHAAALVAVGGLALLADRGEPMPRTRLDLPILALLAAFALATLGAQNHGLALRALAAIIGTVSMLPVALVVLRLRPAVTALVVVVPVLLLAAGTLVTMIPRRLDWYAADGPGLVPPARLAGDGSPFGSVAVPPFIILGVLPLTLLIGDERLRRWLQIGLVVVGVPLTAFSGSRSAWLAIAITALVVAVPVLRRIRLPRAGDWTPRSAGLALLGVIVGAGVLLTVVPRLTAVTSLIYRSYLWRDTLAAWSADPILGIGPGTMVYARQAAAPALTFPVRQPHSHNWPLGLLGDAGIVGLVAGLVLVGAFVWFAGPWRQRTNVGRAAASVLCGFGVAGLFEDLTFLPGFNLVVLLLVALALDGAGLVRWSRLPGGFRRAAVVGVAAAAVVLVMVAGDLAGIAYRAGLDAFTDGDRPTAQRLLERAEALDPWQPSTPKALAVVASWNGDVTAARAAAERAVALNAGDGPSWTNLALSCDALGDRACTDAALDQAIARAGLGSLELINAAVLLEREGRFDDADAAYRDSLLTNRSTGLDYAWARPIDLEGASVVEIGSGAGEMNRLLALRTQEMPIDPADFSDPVARGLALAFVGDPSARSAARAAATADPANIVAWDVAGLLAEHAGLDASHELRMAELSRGGAALRTAESLVAARFDISTFRMVPADGFGRSAVRLLIDPGWPWILEPLLPPSR